MDYPNLWGYTRDIYQYGGIGDTVDAQHIQWHYQVTYYVNVFKVCTKTVHVDKSSVYFGEQT